MFVLFVWVQEIFIYSKWCCQWIESQHFQNYEKGHNNLATSFKVHSGVSTPSCMYLLYVPSHTPSCYNRILKLQFEKIVMCDLSEIWILTGRKQLWLPDYLARAGMASSYWLTQLPGSFIGRHNTSGTGFRGSLNCTGFTIFIWKICQWWHNLFLFAAL